MEYEFDKWDGYGKRPADGSPRVILDLMEYEYGMFRIDGSLETFEEELPEGLEILVDGKPQRYERRAGVVQEQKILKRAAFAIEIPEGQLGVKSVIRFQAESSGAGDRKCFPGEQSGEINGNCSGMHEDSVRTDDDSRKKASVPKYVLTIVTSDYQAKVTSALKHSWWSFGAYVVSLEWQGRTAVGIAIEKMGKAKRMAREAALLKEILTASYGSKQMFVMRGLYWLAMPVYARKNIWLTFDKLYKGGDCGEYFYKYMSDSAAESETVPADAEEKKKTENNGFKCPDENRTRRIVGNRKRRRNRIEPVYVIRKDAKDYERLVREGYHPSAYRSRKQRLSYLYASMVFATHSGVPSFGGFNKWEVRFVQDRIRAVNTCIQHGLSVQDLTYDSNRIVNNNKRYYCASKYEVENLSKASYDYKKEVLRLTGIPRYDGLVNQHKKQILIAPTWRSYAAMPSVMGAERPYNPDFVNTDYYRIYQALLNDRKLRETAVRCGYKIVYLLHPTLNAQLKDFRILPFNADEREYYGSEIKGSACEDRMQEQRIPGRETDHVQVVSSLDLSYEQALTQSGLMVTDYSGVQFDFAYMRKPVVYFHAPELPPHYEEGGFFYDTQGFGEICTKTEELVQVICRYMENGCQLSDFYRKRQDEFFAFNDRENCRRIYEDALQFWQESRRSL